MDQRSCDIHRELITAAIARDGSVFALPCRTSIAAIHRAGDILVVENDPAIEAFLAEVLEDAGYTIRTAHDAETAVASIKQRPPDLVLLDLHLPECMAMRLLADLQCNRAAGPDVVVMTTNTQAADTLSAQNMVDCLLKPFDIDELLDCVAKHIAKRLNI
jgi:DNA-binding response OmpR family regulator